MESSLLQSGKSMDQQMVDGGIETLGNISAHSSYVYLASDSRPMLKPAQYLCHESDRFDRRFFCRSVRAPLSQ